MGGEREGGKGGMGGEREGGKGGVWAPRYPQVPPYTFSKSEQTVQYIPQKMKIFRIAFSNKLDMLSFLFCFVLSFVAQKVRPGTTVHFL